MFSLCKPQRILIKITALRQISFASSNLLSSRQGTLFSKNKQVTGSYKNTRRDFSSSLSVYRITSNILYCRGKRVYRCHYWSLPRFRRMLASRLDDPCNASGFQGVMDTSPTLSIGGSRARAALLTTSGTGTGSTDRRVVFLASQPSVGSSHETKTWPHHWSPHMVCSSSAKTYGTIKWLIDKSPNRRLNSERLTEYATGHSRLLFEKFILKLFLGN